MINGLLRILGKRLWNSYNQMKKRHKLSQPVGVNKATSGN
jgi:hypothetical protein